MDNDALGFLKSHIEDLRKGIEERLKVTFPRTVALTLFDIWKQDLDRGKVVKNRNGVYMSSEPLTLRDLAGKLQGTNSILKPHVTRARAALQASSLPVAGYLLSLNISQRRYSICVAVAEDPLATQRLIWSPYIGRGSIVVGCVKRLFFKINKEVYVRNITVDNDACWDKCDVLKSLIGQGPAHPVRLYAPSGEISAAFALLDLFNNQLDLGAVGALITPYYDDTGKNLVVLGSGIEEPHYEAPPELAFSFKNVDNGVEDVKNGTKFTDKVTGPNLKVHVVVQRWQKKDGGIVTVAYGSHTAAVEAIVKTLVSPTQASNLLKQFPHIERWLRGRVSFEALFAVDLDRDATYFISRTISLVRPKQRKLRPLSKRRPAQDGLKKGAA